MPTFTMILTEKEKEMIENEAKKEGKVKKSIILEAVMLRKVIKEELNKPGYNLSITENDKIIKRLVLFVLI